MNLLQNRNYIAAHALVTTLERSGVDHVCICPGSRSTPLVATFADNPKFSTWVHIDERSAAFFALGIAKHLAKPVALISTSGTATANFLPAIIEAFYSQLPLIILTADRPPELHDWGSNQTITQEGIYGSHVKWAINLPPPESSQSFIRFIESTASAAVFKAEQIPAGPVHINVPFREPLTPNHIAEDLTDLHKPNDHNTHSLTIANTQPTIIVDPTTIETLSNNINNSTTGLIICGPQSDPSFASLVSKLATHIKFPILADTLSQVRAGLHDKSMVVTHYDHFLRNTDLSHTLAPDIIIRFGSTPTSKTLLNYLTQHRTANHILISEERWADPSHTCSMIVPCNPTSIVPTLLSKTKPRHHNPWDKQWRSINAQCESLISNKLDTYDKLFEGRIFRELASIVPNNTTVFAGNSMPVRDLDNFFPITDLTLNFMANRGASGIDGVLSTALGAASASQAPMVLIIGDLSFYHDMNGLLAARQYKLNATIIVINNNGGGIFSFLEQSNYPNFFEKYIATPHCLQFESAANLYGLTHYLISTWADFREKVSESIRTEGTQILEIYGDRELNHSTHEYLWNMVNTATNNLDQKH